MFAKTNPDLMPADKVQKELIETTHAVELNSLKSYAMNSPQEALNSMKDGKFKGYPDITDAEEIRSAENMAYGSLARNKAARDVMQEQTGNQLLADLWKGELIDEQVVIEALDNDNITSSMSKFLIASMREPREIDDYVAKGNIREALLALGTERKTRKEVLSIYAENAAKLTPVTQKTLFDEIYKEYEMANAKSTTQANIELIRMIGQYDDLKGVAIFKDEAQKVGHAIAFNELEDIINDAEDKGKPMTGREKRIKAVELGKRINREILAGKYMVIDPSDTTPESPYPDYPDAFLEDGVWKVRKDNIVYRIED